MTARTAANAVTTALVALTLLPAAALAQPAPAQLAPAQPIIELHAVDATRSLRLAYADSVAYGCVEGIACTDGRGYKLAYEITNQGNGWYTFHHHHMHLSTLTSYYTSATTGATVCPAWSRASGAGMPTMAGR